MSEVHQTSVTVKQALAAMHCTYTTFLRWEDGGLAPRRERLGRDRLAKISQAELAAWLARRDLDRRESGKPHLRKPVQPLGWVGQASRPAALAGSSPAPRALEGVAQ
jgi:hypothetical protein